MRVEHDEQGPVLSSSLDPADLGAPIEKHAETARAVVVPGLGRHLRAVRVDPGYVQTSMSGFIWPVKNRDRRRTGYRRNNSVRRRKNSVSASWSSSSLPVEPADLVVLTIGVVVAFLRASEFVARANHRGALREQEGREKVSHLSLAQRLDFRVFGWAFDAAVPRAIVRMAVAVVLAVRLVVLVVVGDEVAKGETIVGDDEIDACPRLSAAEIEFVGRRAKTGRKRFRARLAPPEVARDVAENVVPFGPARRKPADLVTTRPAVPGLRDQLDLGQQRVLSDRLEKAALGIEAFGLAGEDGAEVEPESVDARLAHPVAQAVGHHLDDARMAEVERVPGSGVVDVVARLIREEPIVGAVVDAFEGQGRPELVSLGGVVVDDVEDHFETGVVQASDHLLEFAQRVRHVRRIAGIGGKKTDRIVAPVVFQTLVEQIAVVDEGVDGQQFDRRHAQRSDVVDDRLGAESGIEAPELLVDLGVQLGEPLDVGFIDDGVVPRHIAPAVFAPPVEIGIDDDGLWNERGAVPLIHGEVVCSAPIV